MGARLTFTTSKVNTEMAKSLRVPLISALLIALAAPVAGASDHTNTLGIGGGYAYHNRGGYAKLFYQHSFASHFRLAPAVSCIFKNKGQSALNMNVDMQYPFNITRGINLYPLTGVAFNAWNRDGGDNYSRFGLDVGAGVDFNFTRQLKLTVQYTYTIGSRISSSYFDLGIGYNF